MIFRPPAHCSRPHLGKGEFFQQQPAYHTRDPFKNLLGISAAHRTSHGPSLFLNPAPFFARSAIRIVQPAPGIELPKMQMFGVTGESLGTIGAQAEVEEQPEWQRLLAAKPSVSVRKGIAWGTNSPTEPTSTLVLTSSKSYFIDIRFSLTGPKPTSPPHYWAFAGVCKSNFPSTTPEPTTETNAAHDVSFPCNIHTTWTRLLDSRDDLTTPDQGTNYLLYNGDCLEVGEMVNPETGTLQSYQELWASPQDSNEAAMPDSAFPTTMTTTPRGNGWFKPQSYPHPSPLPSVNPPPKVRVVLALLHRPTSPATKPQGLILRIGPYCQGIIENPSSSTIHDNLAVRSRRPEDGIVCVERWTLQPKNNTNHSSTSSSIPPLARGMAAAAAAAAKNNNDQDKPAAAAATADADEDTSLEGVWVRDSRSDYEEDAQLGIWMPCVWCCEEAGTRTTMRRELVVGDEMEKDGFVGSWRVAEVEG